MNRLEAAQLGVGSRNIDICRRTGVIVSSFDGHDRKSRVDPKGLTYGSPRLYDAVIGNGVVLSRVISIFRHGQDTRKTP